MQKQTVNGDDVLCLGLPFPCGGTRQLLKLLGRYKHGPFFLRGMDLNVKTSGMVHR